MKIGIDLRMYSSRFTGIGRYCYELVEHLLKIDDKNSYVFFLNDPEYSEFIKEKAALLANVKNGQKFKAVNAEAKYYSFAEQTTFLYKIIKENLDIMHFTHFNAPLFYFRPFIATIHDLTLSFFPGKKMTKFYHRKGYQIVLKNIVKRAKHIIAVSKHTEIDLHRLFNFTRGKTTTIYESVGEEFKTLDIDTVSKYMKKYGIDKKFLLYTGVHRDHKNIIGLIKAFKKLKDKFKFDGYLVLTGKPDPFYPEVKNIISDLQLNDSVKLVGLIPEEDLIAMYNGTAAYVYPSFYEGFGLPALEAFACSAPVVASNTSCIPEICDKAARFFDPNNIDEMAEAINEVLTDKKLAEQLIEQGLARYKLFSWEKMSIETLKIYEKFGRKPKKLK